MRGKYGETEETKRDRVRKCERCRKAFMLGRKGGRFCGSCKIDEMRYKAIFAHCCHTLMIGSNNLVQ